MSPHRFLGLAAIIAVLAAGAAWIYRFRADAQMKGPKPKDVVLDLRFTAPIGYEFCVGKSHKGDDRPPDRLPHRNLALRIQLPPRITDLPPDAPFGTKEIVFRPGKHDVEVYKHLDSDRLIAVHGEVHMEEDYPVLDVKLNMGDLPPGRYVVGISGDPFFGYCTMDFTDE